MADNDENKEVSKDASPVDTGSIDLKQIQAELEAVKSERKQLIDARDKAKEEKRQTAEAKLAEQGEYKTLLEQKEKEFESLTARVTELDGTITTYREKEEAKFQSLLEKVPEALRESINDDSIPLSKRLDLAEKLVGEVKPSGPNNRPPGDTPPGSDLQTQYEEAVKRGDVTAQISLKNRILLDKEE